LAFPSADKFNQTAMATADAMQMMATMMIRPFKAGNTGDVDCFVLSSVLRN
jgi:hypothetical protein